MRRDISYSFSDPIRIAQSKPMDIDSIDAVDLIVRLKEKTGKKPNAEDFKHVRTVSDVVDAIYDLVNS